MNLSNYLVKYGFTRDSLTWVYAQVLGVSTLLLANVTDLHAWFAYVGVNVSELTIHRLSVAAVIALYLGGRYGTSPLPGAPNSVTPRRIS
jgi:hypothetical protein